MKKTAVVIALIMALAVADLALTYRNFIKDSDHFKKNDFEITQHNHPENVWDKVFFGGEAVASSYIEGYSGEGYINLGITGGTVKDILELLKRRYINVGSELVIGLDYFTLYDGMESDPSYIWHKKLYEPYVYFEKDRLVPAAKGLFNARKDKSSSALREYSDYEKTTYRGTLSEREKNKLRGSYESNYYVLTPSMFTGNVNALGKVLDYCTEHDIRVSIVWMPWNGDIAKPPMMNHIRAMAETVINEKAPYSTEILDLENEFYPGAFYDAVNLNRDTGSETFTETVNGLIKGE